MFFLNEDCILRTKEWQNECKEVADELLSILDDYERIYSDDKDKKEKLLINAFETEAEILKGDIKHLNQKIDGVRIIRNIICNNLSYHLEDHLTEELIEKAHKLIDFMTPLVKQSKDNETLNAIIDYEDACKAKKLSEMTIEDYLRLNEVKELPDEVVQSVYKSLLNKYYVAEFLRFKNFTKTEPDIKQLAGTIKNIYSRLINDGNHELLSDFLETTKINLDNEQVFRLAGYYTDLSIAIKEPNLDRINEIVQLNYGVMYCWSLLFEKQELEAISNNDLENTEQFKAIDHVFNELFKNNNDYTGLLNHLLIPYKELKLQNPYKVRFQVKGLKIVRQITNIEIQNPQIKEFYKLITNQGL